MSIKDRIKSSIINRWCHAHPYALVIATIAICIGASINKPGVALTATVALLGYYVATAPRLIAFTLALIVMTGNLHAEPLPPPQKKSAGAVIGGLVIAGGAAFVYWMVRYCQKHFAPKPPPPKKEDGKDDGDDNASADHSADYEASAYQPSPFGSCPPRLSEVDTEDNLDDHLVFTMPPDGRMTIGVVPKTNLVDVVRWQQSWTPMLKTNSTQVVMADYMVRYHPNKDMGVTEWRALQQSKDLKHWTTVMTFEVPEGVTVTAFDVADRTTFYRCETYRDP